MRKILLIFFIFSISSLHSQTPSSSAGTASAVMLRLGTSSRVTGISEAFTGLANDENAIYYNTAGLANINNGILSLNHLEWFQEVRIDNITFGYKFGSNLGSAISISHMWMPSINGFNEQGIETNTFDVSSSIVNLGIGYKLFSGFSLGFGAKYFLDKLADYQASGLAFDLGLLMKTIVPGLTMGVAIQNMGGNVIYDKEAQRIPITYRAGFAYKIPNVNLTFTSDAVKSVDSDYVLNFGVEYNFIDYFTARIGNRFASNKTLMPSFGLGVQFNQKYYINYTFFNLSDLGSTHRFGFSFHFGKSSKIKSYTSAITKKPILIAPENLEINIEDEKLIITWDRVTGTRYFVYAKLGKTGEWKKLVTTPLYSNSLKIKKLPEKGMYYFKVSSVINEKESQFSEEEKIEID